MKIIHFETLSKSKDTWNAIHQKVHRKEVLSDQILDTCPKILINIFCYSIWNYKKEDRHLEKLSGREMLNIGTTYLIYYTT
jgi:hypothetical protein